MLESSDETAVDSLEPELVQIASIHDNSNPEVEQVEHLTERIITQKVETTSVEGSPLRRPDFRVDVETDADCDSELLMTAEEADSLLSSR